MVESWIKLEAVWNTIRFLKISGRNTQNIYENKSKCIWIRKELLVLVHIAFTYFLDLENFKHNKNISY